MVSVRASIITMRNTFLYQRAGQVVLLSRGMHYKVGYFLLQYREGNTKWGNFYYKVGQTLQSRVVHGGGGFFIKSYFLEKKLFFICLVSKRGDHI